MEVIGLYGKGGSGKTATLNLLIDLLDVAVNGIAMPTPQPKGDDRREIFIYKGHKIGVGTAGDDAPAVTKNCDYFASQDCDIIINAARVSQQSPAALNIFAASNGTKVEWVKRFYDDYLQDEVNLVQAKSIMQMI